jgi:hypothetical protein
MRGVIDRVGTDHFDLAVTMPGEVRRSGNVVSVATVPFQSLAALRSLRGQDLYPDKNSLPPSSLWPLGRDQEDLDLASWIILPASA